MQIQIEDSRNNLKVPVINGVYLHSIYNPQKEAIAFAEKHEETIKKKNNILVLGLGFGYHLFELAKLGYQYHPDFKITVIEPNQELFNHFSNNCSELSNSIKIIASDSLDSIYMNQDFITCLLGRPTIIKHDTSFNLNKSFYTNLLTYKAKNNISDFYSNLTEASKNIIRNEDITLKEYATRIKSHKEIENKENYLVLALDHLSNKKAHI